MLVLKLENKLIKEPIGPTAVECSRFLIPINSLQSSEGRGQTSERQTTAAAAATTLTPIRRNSTLLRLFKETHISSRIHNIHQLSAA